MPEFTYNARDASGLIQTGAINAPSRTSAATLLRERGWIIVRIEEIKASVNNHRPTNLTRHLPTRSVHVEVSLQQLAMMLRSGMTLLQSLNSLAKQAPRESLTATWDAIAKSIQRGHGLSQAMQEHKCFPAFTLRLVNVGERTGNLPTVLARAAETMKHRRMSRESFVSATIYPVLVVLLSILVAGYMVIYLIPRLEKYLDSLGRELPAMTRTLIDATFWLQVNYQWMVMAALLATVGIVGVYFSREGRIWIDQALLKVPILGRMIRLSETATFSRGLSMMLKSGITVTDGMSAVEKTLGNHHLRGAVITGREKLIRGSNLVDALNQRNSFTLLLQQMVAVGEQSGDLSGTLDEVTDMSDQQFKATVKRLNALLTPAMTLSVGGVVGYVYIAFFMALVAAGS